MVGEGRKPPGKYHHKDHLAHVEIEKLGLKLVTAKGEEHAPEDKRGRRFAAEISYPQEG